MSSSIENAELFADLYIKKQPLMPVLKREEAIEDYMAGYVEAERQYTEKLASLRQALALAATTAEHHDEFYSLSMIKYLQQLLK